MKHNHAFTIAFDLVNESPDGTVTDEELLEALEARVRYLRNHPDEVVEACGAPFDSYEIEEPDVAAPGSA